MGAASMPGNPRAAFQALLNCAITQGKAPAADGCVGPETRAAVELVAREHPDASADLIAAAYDAFVREHADRRAAVPSPAGRETVCRALHSRRKRLDRRRSAVGHGALSVTELRSRRV